MTDIANTVSLFIKHQFPSFYHSDGPLFVDFVTNYYKWMETQTSRRIANVCETKSHISVTHDSANIVGTNTTFTSVFANGDQIAICKQTSDDDYEIFGIDQVVNNTFLTLTTDKLPQFAFTSTNYGTVSDKPNPLFYGRRLLDINDVDTTLDEFVVYFKEKYLKNIQLGTITQTKTLVKHSLDLYRSKGTERSVDLLFKVAYGVPATVYYPSSALFRTSNGQWKIPKYIELLPSDQSTKLVNKQIVGVKSGAIAFCDSVIRRTINGKIADVAYISAINGSFEPGEKVNSSDEIISVLEAPTILGSLTDITIPVDGVGEDFSVGDIVNVTSTFGGEATARVASIANGAGVTRLTLLEGGYGYSGNAEVTVSESVLVLANVAANVLSSNGYFNDQEIIVQPLANVTYSGATGTLSIGDEVFTYYGNGSLDGTGRVLAIQASNSTAGEFRISVLSGNMGYASVYTSGNSISATVDTYSDITATGNVVGYYSNVVVQATDISGTFTVGENLLQDGVVKAEFYSLTNTSGANGTITVVSANSSNMVYDGITLTGANSGATANVSSITVFVGVKDIGNTFISTTNNYFYSNTLGVNGTVIQVSTGSGADFSVSNTLLYPEYVNVSTTLITTNATHYGPIALNATSYGMPGDPAGNLTSNTIANMLSWANIEIGKIRALVSVNRGTGYNYSPVFRVKEPTISAFNRVDTAVITFTGASASFANGEVVNQSATGGRGLVQSANATSLVIQRMRFRSANDFILTVNSTTTLVGEASGAEANISAIEYVDTANNIGYDAIITTSLASANGTITDVEVQESGFGFVTGETVVMRDVANSLHTANGVAVLGGYGNSTGYYASQAPFLSDTRRLQDGAYWQTYSYEVRSSLTFDKYKDILKQIVHVAGTAMFGNLIHESVSYSNVGVSDSNITTS